MYRPFEKEPLIAPHSHDTEEEFEDWVEKNHEPVMQKLRISITMKVIVLLLLAVAAWAMPERMQSDQPTPTLIPEGLRNTCPGQCLLQDKYKNYFKAKLPKLMEFGKKFAEDPQAAIQSLPPVDTAKWTEKCTEVGNIKTCINACPDDEKKTKALTVITAYEDLACDEEVKAKAQCLQDVAKTPSPTCNEQCKQFFDPLKREATEYYNARKGGAPRDWDKVKSIGKNACLLVNCRVKCRKNDIEQKCQADGLVAAKKYVKELAALAQTAHAQFRPPENFPSECKPDQIIQGI